MRGLLASAEKPQCVLTITLRTPGALLTSPALMRARDLALDAVLEECAARGWPVSLQETYDGPTGPEAVAPISGATALEVKRLAIALEDTGALGPVWNIDVYGANGPVSRIDAGSSLRRCLVCDHDAVDCARTLRHTKEELDSAVQRALGTAPV